MVENPLPTRRFSFDPWVEKNSWRRKWQPTPVFLPRKTHGQGSLVGYIVHGLAKSQAILSNYTTTTNIISKYLPEGKRSEGGREKGKSDQDKILVRSFNKLSWRAYSVSNTTLTVKK